MYRAVRTVTAALVLTAVAASAPAAAQEKRDSMNVTGTWTITVKGTPHGDISATMALEQKGTTVNGTFDAHGSSHAVEGTFSKGALELAATDMPADQRLLLSAKVQSDGSLAGSLSGPVGDARWTATRTKDGK